MPEVAVNVLFPSYYRGKYLELQQNKDYIGKASRPVWCSWNIHIWHSVVPLYHACEIVM